MRYTIIIPPEISRAIRDLRLGREALLALLNGLHHELENYPESHRSRRDQQRPDLYFWFALVIWDGGTHRRFRIVVDDARAPGHFFVVGIQEY